MKLEYTITIPNSDELLILEIKERVERFLHGKTNEYPIKALEIDRDSLGLYLTDPGSKKMANNLIAKIDYMLAELKK